MKFSTKAIINGVDAMVSELRVTPTGLQEIEHWISKSDLQKNGVILQGDTQNKFKQVNELLKRITL